MSTNDRLLFSALRTNRAAGARGRNHTLIKCGLALALAAALAGCCKKGGDKDPSGSSTRGGSGEAPDAQQVVPYTAMEMCSRLVTAGAAKNCRAGSALPTGVTLPASMSVTDIADFDGVVVGGRTAPGKVMTTPSRRTFATLVATLAPLKQTAWNSKGISVFVQTPRQDGDPGWEAVKKRIVGALPP